MLQQEQLRIALRFNAGFMVAYRHVPEGRLIRAFWFQPSLRDAERFRKAPGVKTPGYCQKFLRNKLHPRLKKVLGSQFTYPTFRQGYAAEIERMDKPTY